MKDCLTLFLFILFVTPLCSQPPSVAIIHVNIISMSSDKLQKDMTVLITNNKIRNIGKTGLVNIPSTSTVIDASGKFMIPGLWDMHTHIEISGKEKSFPIYIANGVTGIRDMGGDLDSINKWQQQFATGNLLAPRIVAAGPILDGKTPGFPMRVTVENPAAGKKAVDSLKKRGVNFIKVHNLLPRDAYFAIANEAKKQGLPFAGHVPYSVTATEVSNAGQKSIEHLSGVPTIYNDKKAQILYALFVKNKTWHCPTLVTLRAIAFLNDSDFTNDVRLKYIPAYVRESWDFQINTFFKIRTPEAIAAAKISVQGNIKEVNAMHRAGVQFMAGTDVGLPYVFPGFSIHEELAFFVKAGFTPYEALKTATLNPAIFFGMTSYRGTIENGKNADMVLLDANPLTDINNTRLIHAVIINGKFLPKETLQTMLTEAQIAAGAK